MRSDVWIGGGLSVLLFLAGLLFPLKARAQEYEIDREAYLDAAREIMISARYCALITLDESGQSHVRTLDAFEPGEDMVVWMGTNAHSRKVTHIKNDPRVSLYYVDEIEDGYVSITGIAQIVDDPVEKSRHWKQAWEAFYPDRDTGYTLIRVVPTTLDVMSLSRGFTGDLITWALPVLTFDEK